MLFWLLVIFISLKVVGVVEWSWLIVLIPLWLMILDCLIASKGRF